MGCVPVEEDEVFEEVEPVVAGIGGEQFLDDGGEGDLGLGLRVLSTESVGYA